MKTRIKKVAFRSRLAKIQLSPRNFPIYLKIFRKKIEDASKNLNRVRDYIQKYPEPEDIRPYLRNVHRKYSFDADDFWWVKNLSIRESFSGLEAYELTKDIRFLRNFHKQLEDALKESQECFERLKGIDIEKVKTLYPEYRYDVPRILRDLLLTIPYQVKTLEIWLKDAYDKIGELIITLRGNYKPKTEQTEELYHASVNARSLLRTGFQNKRFSQEGLGGSSTTQSGKDSISFTSDLYVAKEVMRCLKEAVLIAHGQLRRDHLLDWSQRENILPKVLESYRTMSFPGISLYAPENVMALYVSYLALSKRYNPLFFGIKNLVSKLRSKSMKDVGILVCSVDMTNPHIDYLGSMREYRVPPEAIKKIIKIIS